MRAMLLLPILMTVAACDHDQGHQGKLQEAKYRATLADRGIGRFQMIPAASGYPPFVLDTVSGCVVSVSNTGTIHKLPVFDGGEIDKACLGGMPRDLERSDMDTLRK